MGTLRSKSVFAEIIGYALPLFDKKAPDYVERVVVSQEIEITEAALADMINDLPQDKFIQLILNAIITSNYTPEVKRVLRDRLHNLYKCDEDLIIKSLNHSEGQQRGQREATQRNANNKQLR